MRQHKRTGKTKNGKAAEDQLDEAAMKARLLSHDGLSYVIIDPPHLKSVLPLEEVLMLTGGA